MLPLGFFVGNVWISKAILLSITQRLAGNWYQNQNSNVEHANKIFIPIRYAKDKSRSK